MAPLPDFAPQSTSHVKGERGVIGVKWKEQDPVFDPYYQPPGEFPNGIIPELTNVVATASLACEIDLRAAAVKLPNCEYDPRVRPGLVLRIREPQATCILHAKGRMKVMGCKTEYAARQAIRKFARKLQRAALSGGIVRGEVKISKFGIQNIAANVDIGFPISSLERFATEFDNEAIYEPEIGSCVTVSSESPRLTMQIFASGKIVFLGARHRLHVYEAFRQWYPRLLQFKATDRFRVKEESFAEEVAEPKLEPPSSAPPYELQALLRQVLMDPSKAQLLPPQLLQNPQQLEQLMQQLTRPS